MRHYIGILALLMAPLTASATVSFLIDADLLKNQSGGSLSQSSLFMLVSSTQDSLFQDIAVGSSTTIGSLLNADDRIIFKGDFLGSPNTNGVLNTTSGSLTLNSGALTNWTTGDPLALLWFPTLTAASLAIPDGTPYGFYTNASSLDGSEPWVTPADSTSDYGLLFYTADGVNLGPGTNPASAGNASLTVGAVPEPSRSLLGLIGLGVLALRRRRC
jgi:hypothetical protein